MMSISDMSKILNCISEYNEIRLEAEEDELRSMLFDHLVESVRIYHLGCEMQTLLRLQLAYGLEEHLFEVMLTKAIMVSEARTKIKKKMSYVETKGLRTAMTKITKKLDNKSISYRRTAFRRSDNNKNKDGFKRKLTPWSRN